MALMRRSRTTDKRDILRATLVLVFLSTIVSCSVKPTWVPLDKAQLNRGTPVSTTATIYELTYGQTRYMNVAAVVVGALAAISGGVAKGVANDALNGITKTVVDLTQVASKVANDIAAADARQASCDFEKRMGDFDVFAMFADRFSTRRRDLRYFNINVIHNEVEHDKIIHRLITYDDTRLDKAYSEQLLHDGTRYVSAFKFQYGIGARAGGEQFGFTKVYRPYVRIVGLVKDIVTNRFVWGNKITLFSNAEFHGKDEAQNATRERLIDAFQLMIGQLIDVIVRDLNGERFTSEEFIVDYDPNVDDVLAF